MPMDELADYDYELPRELIAQQPLARRSDARLLLLDRRRQTIAHHHVRDLPELLRPGDCLVLNDTRVLPARLIGRRDLTGGRWEGLFLAANPDGLWRVLARSRSRPQTGETVTLLNLQGQDDLQLRLLLREPDGPWIVQPLSSAPAFDLLERVGRVPLPPYIRKGEMRPEDRHRYQTVFARHAGSVAAPTAGLHFTPELLARLNEAGVQTAWVTLHIGRDTFQPIKTQRLEEHRMHSEWGRIDAQTVDQILRARQEGGRVAAVGSTSVRVLETAARSGRLEPWCGQTDLFIRPPYTFRAVDLLLTNFHLPRTTLLAMVYAFGGKALIQRAYAEAIRDRYRFYSYGDAMLIV
jgi:S-adenosylmethionine:tRNA ribosyltransferase-isomerase